MVNDQKVITYLHYARYIAVRYWITRQLLCCVYGRYVVLAVTKIIVITTVIGLSFEIIIVKNNIILSLLVQERLEFNTAPVKAAIA
ncbi:MAG: hypothetical protein ACKESA_01090 [Candidatus Hodgkinia cicadicola]